MTAWKRDIQARAALECARTACAILPSKPSEGPLRTLLLPPARPGSLGDEAMMGVCMAELKRQGQGVGIVEFTEGDRWPDEPPGAEHVDLSAFFGRAYFRSLPGVIAVLRRYDRVWCLGADVMDGHYSPVAAFRRVTLLRLAAELGLDVTALGFSFNDEPSPLVVDALRTLPASVRLCARDPVSQARLIKHLGRPIDAVADLAFGLKPEPHPDDDESALLGWVAARHAEGDIILGLNVSLRAFQSTTGASVDEVVTAYASALSSLFRERSDVSVVAIPHDYRTSRSDTSDDVILRAIADRLEPRDRNRLRQPSFRLQARFVLRLVADIDAVFSARMHLLIAALRSGTPARAIAYQGKLEGLSQLFDLSGLGVAPSVAFEHDSLKDTIVALIDERSSLASRIEQARPAVVALSRENFARAPTQSAVPRLLVVTPEATHPTNKGNRARIADLCDRAAELGWEVHLAQLEKTSGDREAMIAHWGSAFHPIPYRYPLSVLTRAARRLGGAITGNHELAIDDWYDGGVDAYLQALQRGYSFDAVMVEYAHQSRAFEVFGPRVLKILDTHDSLAHRFRQQRELGLRRTGFSTSPHQEAMAFRRADVVIAIQDREREEFQARSVRQVVTVGHRVPVLEHAPKSSTGNRMLFLGSRNQANVDGLRFFLNDVWPRVSPHAELLIAGSVCDAVDIPRGVQSMPVVDDVEAAYRQASIAVVPMRFGTGLKIKTIEAMGRGMATVSTSVGAEGLEEAHGSALLIANTADELVRAIQALLENDAERAAVARRALAFVRGWNRRSEIAFASVLAQRRAAQAAD